MRELSENIVEKSRRPGHRYWSRLLSPTGAGRLRRWPWLIYGLGAATLLLALNLALFTAGSATRFSNGFVAYYTSAQLLREGAPVERYYDDDWFAARISERGPAIYDIYAPNPPTAALLLLPLSGLDQPGARVVWTLLNLAALAGGVGWLLSRLGMDGRWAAGFILLVLLYQPVFASLGQGQVYLLLLGAMVVAWHGFRSGRPALLGVALGTMFALKTAGLFLWLLLVVRRQWSGMAWGMATALLLAVGSLPWLGVESWRSYLALLPGYSARPDMSVTAYQSLPGFLRHLLTYDAQWNPSPLMAEPLAATVLMGLGACLVLGATVALTSRSRDLDLAFSTFGMATLLLSPLSLDYHYVLALIPLAVLWTRVSSRPRLWPALLLGSATALIALDLPYLSPRLAGGPWSLLAYPKLYGALILWGLALWLPLRRHRATSASPEEERQREGGPRDP
jgi:hypothetical protein